MKNKPKEKHYTLNVKALLAARHALEELYSVIVQASESAYENTQDTAFIIKNAEIKITRAIVMNDVAWNTICEVSDKEEQ